jgi:hypothetical protein
VADYSSQEINTAVTSLVQSGVSTPLDTLGTRRTDIAFSQVQQAVAGVFILYPLAPYYCLYLGAQQVLQAVASEAATIASILEAIESLNRYVLPVTDLSPLYNAQSALQALQGAVATTAPSDITKLAQYQRFASNVNAFLAGPGGQAVKQNGAIVPTPAEAQASLPGLITTLQQQHTALVTSITQLANGITSYQSVNLPSLVAAGVITNASSVLASDTATLAALTPAARTAALRTPILNLITSMAAVTTMGSSGNTSEFYNVPGPGTTYSDSLHLATPASLDGNLGPPYNIQTGVNDQLTLTMDGAAPFSVTVPGALGAQIQGTVVEQPSSEASPGASPDGFLISDGTNPHPIYVNGNPANGTVPTPAANNQLQFMAVGSIDSYDVVVLLTTSVVSGDNVIRRTAQEICDDINAELATRSITGIVAEPYFYPTAHFNGAMNIVPTTGPTAEFYPYVAGASSLTPVQVGDILVILTGPDADIWDVTAVSPTFVTANARVVTPVAASDVATEIGPKDRAIGLYVVDPALIGQGMYLQILGSNVTFTNGANTIGWPVNSIFNSTLRVPYDIYTAINQQTTEVTAASTLLDPISLPLTTDPVNPFHVVISKVFEVGSLVYTPGSPNSISLTGFTGLEAGGVLVGDTLVLRGQNNTAWTVTAFTDTTVTATSSVNTATTTPSATFEIGSTLPTIVDWYTVVVDSGPNSGSYVVSSFGVSPLDLIFQQRWTIPHYADQTTLEPITMTGSIGIEVLTLTSENTTVSSSVLVSPSCTALPFFWSSPPAISYGSTPYLLIPTPTGGAVPQPGDIVTFYQTNYGAPSQTCTVETVDPSVTGTGYILGLSPEIQDLYGSTPSNSWPFPPNQIPYATLMHGHMVDFAVFQTACTTWLAQVPNQPAYFQTIDRLMNPITSSTNPTMANVNAAIAGIKALADLLDIADNEADLSSAVPIEMVLDDYVVVDMPQIDTLIQTYKQKGADLALDTLTSGQFATFFGLTEQQSSYAGAMQGAMTAVAQNDLPVRKGNRPDSLSSRLLGNAPSDDPEFNTEDSDTGLKPDATSDFQKD